MAAIFNDNGLRAVDTFGAHTLYPSLTDRLTKICGKLWAFSPFELPQPDETVLLVSSSISQPGVELKPPSVCHIMAETSEELLFKSASRTVLWPLLVWLKKAVGLCFNYSRKVFFFCIYKIYLLCSHQHVYLPESSTSICHYMAFICKNQVNDFYSTALNRNCSKVVKHDFDLCKQTV